MKGKPKLPKYMFDGQGECLLDDAYHKGQIFRGTAYEAGIIPKVDYEKFGTVKHEDTKEEIKHYAKLCRQLNEGEVSADIEYIQFTPQVLAYSTEIHLKILKSPANLWRYLVGVIRGITDEKTPKEIQRLIDRHRPEQAQLMENAEKRKRQYREAQRRHREAERAKRNPAAPDYPAAPVATQPQIDKEWSAEDYGQADDKTRALKAIFEAHAEIDRVAHRKVTSAEEAMTSFDTLCKNIYKEGINEEEIYFYDIALYHLGTFKIYKDEQFINLPKLSEWLKDPETAKTIANRLREMAERRKNPAPVMAQPWECEE